MSESLPVWHLYIAAFVAAALVYMPFALLAVWIWAQGFMPRRKRKAKIHAIKNDPRLVRKPNERVRVSR